MIIIFRLITRPSGITQDIFRNTTFIIDSDGKIARCGGDYTVVVETVPVHGLAVDWVANNLYWIRTDTEVSTEVIMYAYVHTYLYIHMYLSNS